MRRLTFRLAVAFTTFTIGVTVASLWFVIHRPSAKVVPAANIPAPPTQVEVNRTYRPGMHAQGWVEDGSPACFGTVESSDGANFSWTTIRYNSPKRVNKELNKKLAKAVEIIKRKVLFDRDGKKVGEQVIATFGPAEEMSAVSAELLWTNGANFGYVSSTSLENILAYEKDQGR